MDFKTFVKTSRTTCTIVELPDGSLAMRDAQTRTLYCYDGTPLHDDGSDLPIVRRDIPNLFAWQAESDQ